MSVLLRRYYQLLRYSNYGKWLTGATMHAIVGAFRNEGLAVIAATNEYLSGIAAQGQAGKAKATALASLINEDPMMVCSLPMSEYLPSGFVMPERYLIGDGASYILSGFTASKTIGVECKATRITQSPLNIGDMFMTDVDPQSNRFGLSYYNGVTSFASHYNSTYHINTLPDATIERTYSFNVEQGKLKVDGVDKVTWTWNVEPGGIIAISGNNMGNSSCIDKKPYFKFIDNTNLNVVGHYIPYKHPTQGNGMLDLVNVVFYPNAGTGQFTIPDISYTPTP